MKLGIPMDTSNYSGRRLEDSPSVTVSQTTERDSTVQYLAGIHQQGLPCE